MCAVWARAECTGACRWVWNRLLAQQQFRWQCWQDCRIGLQPQVTFFGLGTEFTALRRSAAHIWLQTYGHKEVKYTLKLLADAYQRFFRQQGGHPQCKARHRTVDGFTIPSHVSIFQG